VNGDGMLNIADPVYLCRFLFSDGPALVPIVCPPTGLPATGQTQCYAAMFPAEEIGCASANFPGQDGHYQAGCPKEGRFVDNKDGTVTDACTGLMWQKDTADVNGDGSIGNGDRLNWQEALKYCDSLDFAAHGDWRLPNVRELLSIVDYGRANPAIDPVFGVFSDRYLSSTSDTVGPDQAWSVSFGEGYVFDDDKILGFGFIRAARNAP
jgi:hypothetical protein